MSDAFDYHALLIITQLLFLVLLLSYNIWSLQFYHSAHITTCMKLYPLSCLLLNNAPFQFVSGIVIMQYISYNYSSIHYLLLPHIVIFSHPPLLAWMSSATPYSRYSLCWPSPGIIISHFTSTLWCPGLVFNVFHSTFPDVINVAHFITSHMCHIIPFVFFFNSDTDRWE